MDKHFQALDKRSKDHQDWKPVTVRTKKNINESKKSSIKKVSESQQRDQKILKQDAEGDLKHKKVSPELRKQLQQTRSSMGLTQKQLSQRVNFPVSVINDIETGKAIYNHQQINKIKRSLNL